MKRLLIIWFAITPLLLGAYCSVNVQPRIISEVQKRATAFAAGEYPDLIISEMLYVTPFMTPTATYSPTALHLETPRATDFANNITPVATNNPNATNSPNSTADNRQSNNGTPAGTGQATAPPTTAGTPVAAGTPTPDSAVMPTATPNNTPIPTAAATPNNSTPTPKPVDNPTPTPKPDAPTPITPTPTDMATIEPSATPIIPTDEPTANPSLPDIAFSQSTYQVHEGATTAIITVVLNSNMASAAQVTFNTQDDTAIQSFDYQSKNQALTFTKNQTQLTVTVPIMDNETDNTDTQTVLLKLSNPFQANVVQDTAILEILDNDNPPTLQFAQSQFNVMENQTSLLTVTLSHPSGKFVAVGYELLNPAQNTAISGADYQAFTIGSLGFAPDATGRTPTQITFSWSELINDSQAEANKALQFRLLDPPTNATLGNPFTTTLTIKDDDAQ